jgi:hypothetical protein
VQWLTFPEQLFTVDSDITLAIVQHNLLRLDDILNQVPVLSFDSLKDFVIRQVSFGNSVAFIADDNNNVIALDQVWECHD